MRIGMFTDMYMPHVSGVTNHVKLYKKRYEELGHEVFLFTFGNRDYVDNEPNVIRSTGIPWGDTGWSFSVAFGSKARKLIPTLDIIHVHHPFQSGRMALPFCEQYNIPLVFTNHTRYDLYSDSYASFVPQGARYGALKMQLKRFTHSCSLVITPSESIAQWLKEFVEYSDACTIPNGIDIGAFRNPSRTVSRADLGIADDAIVFCYAGRVAPEKNTDYLISEFLEVAKADPRAVLLVVGGGTDFEAAQAKALESGYSDRFIFTGMKPYENLPGFEALGDVFVTSSVSEVHPLVVLEAMAAGLPIVAVHSPGISDTVEHDISGLLADQCAPGALAKLMLELAQNNDLRRRLSEGASQRANEYSFEKTADIVLEHYAALLADDAQLEKQ